MLFSAGNTEFDDKGMKRAECRMCNKFFDRVDVHVLLAHNVTLDRYLKRYPGAPFLSDRFMSGIMGSVVPPSVAAPPVVEDTPVPAPAATDDAVMLAYTSLAIRSDVPACDLPFIPAKDKEWNMTETVKYQWNALGVALHEGEPSLMVGPTGCGKSAGFLELAARLNQPVRRVNLHGDVRVADFLGEKIVEVDPDTKQSIVRWKDGILPQAVRTGQWLLLDELDAAPPQILFVLQGLLEKGGNLVLTGNEGEVIKPHANFRVVATANTLGRGDESGLYAGTHVLNEAFLDRFGVVIECDYPTVAQETSILMKKNPTLNKDDAKKMVDIANSVRTAFKRDECSSTFSTRRLLSWARKTVIMNSALKASEIAVLNKMTGDDRKFVSDLIQRHWGGAIK